MAIYSIYHSNGTLLATTHRLTHSDNFMGENCVTVDIKSPVVIDFAIGDYLDYRGHRYYMAVTPTVTKKASSGSVGGAFEYESVKFVSAAGYDLTRIKFRDVVPSSLASTYHTNFAATSFPLYCESLVTFGERLKANLDRVCTGASAWTVLVRQTDGTDYECGSTTVLDHSMAMGEKGVAITIDDQFCWDALSHVPDDFKVNFFIVDRTITLGATAGVVPHYFQYGKGNGVFSFKRSTDDSQAVVTVARAYGGETNMPLRYYNDKSGSSIGATINVKKLMLPGFGVTPLSTAVAAIFNDPTTYATLISRIQDAVEEVYGVRPSTYSNLTNYVSFSDNKEDPYIVAVKPYAALGYREYAFNFDGSGDYEDIHPDLKWLGDSNKIVAAEQLTDNGTTDNEDNVPDQETFWVKVNLSFNPADKIPLGSDSFTVHMQSGMCGGRDFNCIGVENVSGTTYKLTLQRVEDSNLDLWFPYKDFNIQAGDEFVLTGIEMPDEYVDGTSLLELLPQAIKALLDNCGVRYKYSLDVDNIQMARQHDSAPTYGDSIYNTITAGQEIYFGDKDLDINYDAESQTVTGDVLIDKLEIKEEDGKLPQYEITLVDEVSIGSIEQIQKQIEAITTGKTTITGGYSSSDIQSIVKALGDSRYLRKDKADGTNYSISIGSNLNVGGNAYVAGSLHVTKLIADNVEIMEARHVSGKVISSAANCELTAVYAIEGGWRCYFAAKDENGEAVYNMWQRGDLAFCQQFYVGANGDWLQSKAYWRQVISVGTNETGNYIDLSNISGLCSDTFVDYPEAGDTVVLLGNAVDEDRQGAIIQSPIGTFAHSGVAPYVFDAPYICVYDGIDTFSLPNPTSVVSPGLTLFDSDTIMFTSGGAAKIITGTEYDEESGLYYANALIYGDNITLNADHIMTFNAGSIVINSSNFTLDAEGNVTATNGNFSGTVNATSGSFAGIVLNTPVHINAANFSEKMIVFQDTGAGTGLRTIAYNFDVIYKGNVVVFDEDVDLSSYTDETGDLIYRSVYIQLPGCNTMTYTAEDKYIIKQLLGRTIAFYNNSAYDIAVNNIGTSVPVAAGRFVIFQLCRNSSTSAYYWEAVDSGLTSDLPFESNS